MSRPVFVWVGILILCGAGCAATGERASAARLERADRLFSRIEVGMMRKDVERLVGMPRGQHSNMDWYLGTQASSDDAAIGIMYDRGIVVQKYLFTPRR